MFLLIINWVSIEFFILNRKLGKLCTNHKNVSHCFPFQRSLSTIITSCHLNKCQIFRLVFKLVFEPEDPEGGRLREGGDLSVVGNEEDLDAVRQVEELLGLSLRQELTLIQVPQLVEGLVHVGAE